MPLFAFCAFLTRQSHKQNCTNSSKIESPKKQAEHSRRRSVGGWGVGDKGCIRRLPRNYDELTNWCTGQKCCHRAGGAIELKISIFLPLPTDSINRRETINKKERHKKRTRPGKHITNCIDSRLLISDFGNLYFCLSFDWFASISHRCLSKTCRRFNYLFFGKSPE